MISMGWVTCCALVKNGTRFLGMSPRGGIAEPPWHQYSGVSPVCQSRFLADHVLVTTAVPALSRRGYRRRPHADRLLRLERAGIERQSGHQEQTDQIHRIGLRRRDRPPRKTSDRRRYAGFVFHPPMLELCRNRSRLSPPSSASCRAAAPALRPPSAPCRARTSPDARPSPPAKRRLPRPSSARSRAAPRRRRLSRRTARALAQCRAD